MGLLFDHGCDAFTTGMQTLIFAKCSMTGGGPIVLITVIMVQMPFFMATLEEYYVGALYLPIGNGVSDGSIFLIAAACGIGYFGSEAFASLVEVPYFGVEMKFCHQCYYAICFTQVFFVLSKLIEIGKAYFKPFKKGEDYREPVEFLPLLKQMTAYLSVVGSYFVFCVQNGAGLEEEAPLLIALLFSWIQVHLTMNVMLCHITRTKFEPLNNLYLFHMAYLISALAAHHCFHADPALIRLSFYCFGAVTILAQWHFICGLFFDLSQALELSIFTVPATKHKNK